MIEVLTERATNAYRTSLRNLEVSYVIAGKERLDYALAVEKLKEKFGIETLMLVRWYSELAIYSGGNV